MQGLIIISYSEDWEKRCPRGCCREGRGVSEFAINYFNCLDEAVDFLAKRIQENINADQLNIVVDTQMDCMNLRCSATIPRRMVSIRLSFHALTPTSI